MHPSIRRRPRSERLWIALPLIVAAMGLASCGKDGVLLSPDGLQGVTTLDLPLKRISPDTATAGSGAITITVVGRSFGRGSVVLWNGRSLPTVPAGKTQLKAAVSAADLAAGGTYEVRVFTPSLPGFGGFRSGSVTLPLTFTVNHAVPTVGRIAPDTVLAGTPGAEVTVEGTGFAPATVARWNGAPRPTRFVSRTEIAVTLPAEDLATASLASLTVFNPAPGGGTSAADTLVVANAVPHLAFMHTRGATAGGGGFALTVGGTGFLPTSTVRWNGSVRTTTLVSPTRLLAAVTAADVASAGRGVVTVVSPGPGGGASNPDTVTVRHAGSASVTSQVTIPLHVRDMVWDPGTQRLYASVYDSGSIAIINPATATVEAKVPIGGNPRALALTSDGQFLYVALDGDRKVRRFDTATRTAGPSFTLGASWLDGSALGAEEIAVMPDSPYVVAVSTRNFGFSPRHEGVVVFDHGVRRAAQTPGHTGSNSIAFGPEPGVLWGQNTETTEFGTRRMRVDASGVEVTSVAYELFSGVIRDIAVAGGRLYGDGGDIVDPDRSVRLGSCTSSNAAHMDVETGRLFQFDDFKHLMTICDANTFHSLGSFTAYGFGYGLPVHLVRWGTDGLAYHDWESVYIIRSPIVAATP